MTTNNTLKAVFSFFRPRTTEEAIEQIEEYEATPHGKRLLRSLELSKNFKPCKEWGGLSITHHFYFVCMAYIEGIDEALYNATKLSFRAGYMAAQRDAKKRK